MNPINTNDEMRGLNSGLPSDSKNPYRVPEGYFDGLAVNVLAKIREHSQSASDEISELSPLLAGISRLMPYKLPEHYFESKLADIPFLIDEKEESAMLSYIGKEMPFVLPDDYFEHLPKQILARIATPGAKVIPMVRRKWMRMAAAAMVAGIIGLTGISIFRSDSSSKDPINVIKKASTYDLNAFLNSTNANLSGSATAQNQASDVKEMVQDMPDNDLNAFLNQVPTDDVEPLTN